MWVALYSVTPALKLARCFSFEKGIFWDTPAIGDCLRDERSLRVLGRGETLLSLGSGSAFQPSNAFEAPCCKAWSQIQMTALACVLILMGCHVCRPSKCVRCADDIQLFKLSPKLALSRCIQGPGRVRSRWRAERRPPLASPRRPPSESGRRKSRWTSAGRSSPVLAEGREKKKGKARRQRQIYIKKRIRSGSAPEANIYIKR